LYIDPSRLAMYHLTPLDIQHALDNENVEMPGGKIAGNNTELIVNTKGRLLSPDDFNNLIIRSDSGRVIHFSDVGEAMFGAENEETNLKESGIPMVGLALVPQPGANYIDIAKEFYKRMDALKKEIPKDFELNIALDNTRFILQSIEEVEETLLIAIILVILIIYVFFRDWLIALRPLIDIPVSLIGTFFIMYLLGFSINILTLLAIVLATGLVVDDGIVVTENIFKKIEKGMSPMEAALKGSNEVYFAVISTSITLAAVFLPIIFLEGFTGRLFREFGIAVAGAVLISAFVSLSLTPVLNVLMMRKGHRHSKFYEATEKYFVALTDGYESLLRKFLNKRWLAFPIIIICIAMIYFIGGMLQSELAPLDDRSVLRVSASAPEGATYEYMDHYMNEVIQFINDSVPEKRVALTVVAPGFTGSGAANSAFMRLSLVPPDERERTQQQIADYLSKNFSSFPGAKSFVIQEQTISVGASARTGLPVQFVIQAPNFEKLRTALPKFMELATKDSVFQGVDVNLKFNKPELNISIDRERAKNLGVSVLDIAQTLRLAYSGTRFAYFNMNGKQYQVIGQVNRTNRDEPLDLKSLYVRNNKGALIQMDNLVQVKIDASPPQLYHFNRYMSATVSAGLAPGKTIGDGLNEMEKISSQVLDDSFSTDVTGASRDYKESSSNILFAFILALLLIYLVLAAQFESFVDPFIIMITVPLAIAGALLSLWYFNQTLNIFSQIGIIVLVGLVTKNGILIVEFANQQKELGLQKLEAVRIAAVLRLRPILMTSLATALGALPIALALGAGAKSRMSLGIVVIGGLIFSLILTLLVIPAMYSYLSRKTSNKSLAAEE